MSVWPIWTRTTIKIIVGACPVQYLSLRYVDSVNELQ